MKDPINLGSHALLGQHVTVSALVARARGHIQSTSDEVPDTLRELDHFTFAPQFEIDQIVSLSCMVHGFSEIEQRLHHLAWKHEADPYTQQKRGQLLPLLASYCLRVSGNVVRQELAALLSPDGSSVPSEALKVR